MPAYPVGGRTTSLKQFIEQSIAAGCELRESENYVDGDFGPARIRVLANGDRYALLPMWNDDDVLLTAQMVDSMKSRLGI